MPILIDFFMFYKTKIINPLLVYIRVFINNKVLYSILNLLQMIQFN